MVFTLKNLFTKPFLAATTDWWNSSLAKKYDGFFCTFAYHVLAGGSDFPQETCVYLNFRGGVLQPYLVVGKKPEHLWDSVIYSGSPEAWQQFIADRDAKHVVMEELFANDDDAKVKRSIGQAMFKLFDNTEDRLKEGKKPTSDPEKCVRVTEDGYLLFAGGMQEVRAVVKERKVKTSKDQFSSINRMYEQFLTLLKKGSPKDMSAFWSLIEKWPEPDLFKGKSFKEIYPGTLLAPGLKRELLSMRSSISNGKDLYEGVQKRLKAGIQ